MASMVIPGLGGRDEIPSPNPGVNPMAAGLTAQEGWVFSRVDGHPSFAELFLITGLGEMQTVELLKTLVSRGLVLTKDGSPTPQQRVPTPVPHRAGTPVPPPVRTPVPKAAKPVPPPARTPVPATASEDEVERMRAEARAAEEALG